MINGAEELNNSKKEIIDSIESDIKDICEDHDIIAVYLYGSFVRGEEHQKSDIDMAVQFRDYSLKNLLRLSRKIREKIDVPLELDIQALNKASPRFQHSVIQKGEVIYESSPEKRANQEVEIARKYHELKHHLEEHWEERKKRVIEDG